MKAVFQAWQYVIDKNRDARAKGQTPIASLIEFYSGTTKLSNGD